MKAKKVTTIFLTAAMAIGLLAGCGSTNDSSSASNSDNNKASVNETESTSGASSENTADNPSISTEDGKTLVVYYSATGNTKSIAQEIADVTGGNLFEIEPKEPYTSDDLDWSDDNSRVSKEHDDESLRDVELVSTTVDDWDSYDTVYIGYPIWWGIAAWPVDGFVKANDFTGKTVIPFCTSASSGIGNSGDLLKNMAGTGDWKDGERFRGSSSESDVRSWVESLGL